LQEEGDRYLPLLRHTLKRSRPEFGLPGGSNGRIKKLRAMTAARNIFLFEELKKVLQGFSPAGIETILLKGVMMEEIYPPGLRPFSDIDLLIRRENLSGAMEILRDLGYRPYDPQSRPQGVNYVKGGELPVMIDPHWTLGCPPYRYLQTGYIEGVWERARKAKVAGVDALVLCPEDCLLHLCLHLFHHRQGGWVTSACDIAELIHHYKDGLDWQAFLSRVFELKISLPVQYSLQKTSELFEPPVPSFVLEQLHTCKPSRFEGWAFALLTSRRDKDFRDREALAQLFTMPGASLKLRYVWTVLAPQKEFMLRRYAITDPTLLPLYYLLHLSHAFSMALKALSTLTSPRNISLQK